MYFVIVDLLLYVYFYVLLLVLFYSFLQGLPNGPGVPTEMNTDQIPPAITMATDARMKPHKAAGKNNEHKQANKNEIPL